MKTIDLTLTEQRVKGLFRKTDPEVRGTLVEHILDLARHGRDTGDYDPMNRALSYLTVHETLMETA